ncbi:MAG: hypothetical protein IH797_07305, partial [Chloroflexi bacterium]|nr:hypothetical protein [Chloroflexota bacterium]
AIVEPGDTYFLKIEEPPRNVVFLWDTSASVGAYLPVIYNSLIGQLEAYYDSRAPDESQDQSSLSPQVQRFLRDMGRKLEDT